MALVVLAESTETAPTNAVPVKIQIIAASTFIWAFATTLVKLSLLSLYLQLFKSQLLFRILAYIVATLSTMLALSGILLGILFCQPFAYNWDHTIEGGHCGDSPKFQLSTAIVNMLLDFFVVLLPMPVLWSLKMSRKRKLMLSAIFSLGLWWVAYLPTYLPTCHS